MPQDTMTAFRGGREGGEEGREGGHAKDNIHKCTNFVYAFLVLSTT